VIGGVLSSTVLTLLVLPALYRLAGRHLERKENAQSQTAANRLDITPAS
jgi:hypothetical protein